MGLGMAAVVRKYPRRRREPAARGTQRHVAMAHNQRGSTNERRRSTMTRSFLCGERARSWVCLVTTYVHPCFPAPAVALC